MIDFDKHKKNLRFYAGEAGRKFGVDIEGDPWIIKFPQSTKGMKAGVSYTTSPLSEYLGSKIYASLGIPVHETALGLREGKIVVGCKDFLSNYDKLVEFRAIKNAFFDAGNPANDGTGSSSDLEEILSVLSKDELLRKIPGCKDRFWDMFVVDAIIGNPDRNNTNWGFIEGHDVSTQDQPLKLAPVYDNGNAFFNKRSDNNFASRMGNSEIDQDAFGTNLSFYTKEVDGEKKRIKPFDYLRHTDNTDALEAVKRTTARINLSAVDAMIDEIPTSYRGLEVINDSQREFYKKLVSVRLNDSKKGLLGLL